MVTEYHLLSNMLRDLFTFANKWTKLKCYESHLNIKENYALTQIKYIQ